MMMLMAVAAMAMMSGCDSEDFGYETDAELLSVLYPEIFDTIKGDDGDSAYQVAVNEGYEGSVEEWLQSLVGEAGADGDDGVCLDCNVTDPEDPVIPVIEDDLVHLTVWYTRNDIAEPTFEHYIIVDGFPTLRSTVYPGADENHTMEDVNGTTFLNGTYTLEDNSTDVHAIGVQFNQITPEVEPVEEEL